MFDFIFCFEMPQLYSIPWINRNIHTIRGIKEGLCLTLWPSRGLFDYHSKEMLKSPLLRLQTAAATLLQVAII